MVGHRLVLRDGTMRTVGMHRLGARLRLIDRHRQIRCAVGVDTVFFHGWSSRKRDHEGVFYACG
ncbi:hypothetical protein ASE26_12730 [Duganella sp. Root198D2]|nr:hypothetical protein ASD07_19885 [Duganella sp. Root336D2]KRB83332.1 hypothetical protein ASE26_12730 [Duganella sp. Root198D2]